MPGDLLESTLFGHVKGAFTSAIASKKGLFEVADKGTLFLDELAPWAWRPRPSFCAFCKRRSLCTSAAYRKSQLTCASCRHQRRPTPAVKEGHFREDLFYRLNVINIDLPPLRQRKEDIPLLVDHFLKKYSEENERRCAASLPKPCARS